MERINDVSLLIKEYENADIDRIISTVDKLDFMTMNYAFIQARNEAESVDNLILKEIYTLLSNICSMALSYKERITPYKPFYTYCNERSFCLDDLTADDILFISAIVESIENDWLKARIADVIWLKSKPKDTKYAKIAIKSFMKIPYTITSFHLADKNCIGRAISLINNIKEFELLHNIEEIVFNLFKNTTYEDRYLLVTISDFLLENNFIKNKDEIINKLTDFSKKASDEEKFSLARGCSMEIAKWYKKNNQIDKHYEMLIEIAKCWETEALYLLNTEPANNMNVSSCYENALQIYRPIPNNIKIKYQIQDKIKKLKQAINKANEEVVVKLQGIHAEEVDISNMRTYAINQVSGKSLPEALLFFVNLYPFVNTFNLEKNLKETIQKYPLQFMMSVIMHDKDGRIIYTRPGCVLNEDIDSKINKEFFHAEMIKSYLFYIPMIVQGCLIPALNSILFEHSLDEQLLVNIVSNSPIIPKNRIDLFVKGLVAGFNYDFTTAIHILAPQMENLVRVHLKESGVETIFFSEDGSQDEYGLHKLINFPEAEKIFGESIRFEINALFCDRFGVNIRNKIAHGLFDESDAHSIYIVYAWWFILKLAYLNWWNRSHQIEK